MGKEGTRKEGKNESWEQRREGDRQERSRETGNLNGGRKGFESEHGKGDPEKKVFSTENVGDILLKVATIQTSTSTAVPIRPPHEEPH